VRTFIAELGRRRVWQTAIGYAAISWLVIQFATQVFPAFDIPVWASRLVVLLLALGFPFVLFLSWMYAWTRHGFVREADLAPKAESANANARNDASATPSSASIAVLPFTDMSQNHDQEYFSHGLAEELINLLAKVPNLHVAGRTSSFSFRDKDVIITEVGRALNVATVLEGSVRKSGDHLRVTVQLIDVADDFHLWSETYDRELTDIFLVQDEIAAAVVTALKMKLLPGELPSSSRHHTPGPEAYSQFLLGRHHLNRGTPAGFVRAVEAYRQAVKLEPAYAQAYAGIALAQYAAAGYSNDAAAIPRGQREAMDAAEEAVRLDLNLAEAYAARGYLRGCYSWDWQGAHADLVRALALNPADDSTHERYARLLASLGRLPEAIATARAPLDKDPLSSRIWYVLGRLQAAHGDLVDARRSLERVLVITPEHAYAPLDLGLVALLEGNPAAARVQFERAPTAAFRLTGLAIAEFDLGNAKAAQDALDALVREHAQGYAYQIAEVHAWRGEKDQAFVWLDRASAQRDAGLQRLKYDPTLRKLHGDARYVALLRRLHFPEN
jgi:serine/threonine-protein kinase